MNKYFYISTPIYYPSGKPHLGHAFSTIFADVLAKYKKLQGYNVFFVTGTDEHGQKIEDNAKLNKLDIMDYINNNVNIFLNLWNKLNIKYSVFIRTTNKKHIETLQKVFSECFRKKLIYFGDWKTWYCTSCEENYSEENIIKKDDKNICIHGHKLILKNEKTYFIKISKFNDWILSYLNKHFDFIYPNNRAKELINNFLVNNKLEDLSITRSSFSWGIPIIENKEHILYVWIDALFSYLSSLGYLQKNNRNFLNFWDNKKAERVHVLSKEITRFHCIYWPILLKIMNLNLPTKIISHGWIITKEGKMSKSLGNVIDPFELIDKYGSDALRYCLLKEISLKEDSYFSEEKFVSSFNMNLANNYGNLVSRIKGMIKKYNKNNIPNFCGFFTENDIEIKNATNLLKININKNIKEMNTTNILENISNYEKLINNYIEKSKPWEMKKNNDDKNLNNFLSICYSSIKIVIFLLSPVIPEATLNAKKQLNIKDENFNFKNIYSFHFKNNKKLNEGDILFKRIENYNENNKN